MLLFVVAGCTAFQLEDSSIAEMQDNKLEVAAVEMLAKPKDSTLLNSDESIETQVKLGRGMNIGNALESPRYINWGVEMKYEYFDTIKEAGFDTVRLPVRFSDYSHHENGILEDVFIEKIDAYINYALDLGLLLILDFHHFEEIKSNPEGEKERFISIWSQLAERYKDYPNRLVFELLNEPKDNLSGDVWNLYIQEAVSVIRETNPARLIIVGGAPYNSVESLETLSLPNDENLVVTFHYYAPAEFAFQGNPYHAGYEDLHSIKWTATEEEVNRLRTDFSKVRDWAKENNVDVFLGELGIVKTVPFEYRSKWTKAVIDTAEEMGFSWAYWELASHFGIFDAETFEWDVDMLNILIK